MNKLTEQKLRGVIRTQLLKEGLIDNVINKIKQVLLTKEVKKTADELAKDNPEVKEKLAQIQKHVAEFEALLDTY